MGSKVAAEVDAPPFAVGDTVKMSPSGLAAERERVVEYLSGPNRERAEREYARVAALRGRVLSVNRKARGWAWTVRVMLHDRADGGRVLGTYASNLERA